ncbi:MAG: DUF4440 domain-containing protein, partial [Reyranella sp.]
MKMKLLIAASAMMLLAACTPPGAPTAEAPAAPAPVVMPTQGDIDALYTKMDAALKAKDAAALAAMYAPGAVSVHPFDNDYTRHDAAAATA